MFIVRNDEDGDNEGETNVIPPFVDVNRQLRELSQETSGKSEERLDESGMTLNTRGKILSREYS